ncbi:hypothetical protein P4E94_19130 [Pontiellaceae bacterium B12219]|nr:hypothetical protein [Pontiellaceae bacterium B12219]
MKIKPVFSGPMSVGTIELIKLLRERLSLSLREAKTFVDSCVFDNQEISIPVPEGIDAHKIISEIQELDTPAQINIRIE